MTMKPKLTNLAALLPDNVWLYVLAVAVLFVLFVSILIFNFGMIYIRALTSGAKVKFSELVALRLRGVPVGLIVDSRITAVKAGPDFAIDDPSTPYFAGGNMEKVVVRPIAPRKARTHPEVLPRLAL